MPRMIGGAKYLRRKHAPRNRIASIEKKEYINKGTEGILHHARITLQSSRGKSKRTINMAMKEINPETIDDKLKLTPARMRKQLKLFHHLRELNRTQHAGFNLLGTLRLYKERGKRPVFVKTFLPLGDYQRLGQDDLYDFADSMKDQIGRLEQYGIQEEYKYFTFHPYRDPKTKKVIAVINDLGNLSY